MPIPAQPAAETAPTPEAPPRRGRGRRPADDVRADVLRTVGGLLLAEGLTDFTIERVARLSGVSKTTIYKWWPSRGALALDGYFHAVEPTLAFPETEDIRADLATQLHAFGQLVSQTPAGRLLAELIGASQTDTELAIAYRALYSSQRRHLAVARMQRAQATGQLRADVEPQVVVDQLWGAVYHRLLVPDEPITPQFIDALLSNLLGGILTSGHEGRAARAGEHPGSTRPTEGLPAAAAAALRPR